ncbi:hypothetical protein ACIA5C_16830 [Actinoplanes sp. NPDC051343]|uniref:hypothetical protein n=1 Tax=Actinoplanes sp. NPDC051343 TaxID=3363906 RepID=UPI0037952E85
MTTPFGWQPPPALFPGRHFLAPVGRGLRNPALPQITAAPQLTTHAALPAEAEAATLLITDRSGRPVSELPTYGAGAKKLVVVVGQPVELQVHSQPVHPVTDVRWTISGKAVHTATQEPDKCTVTPLNDGHLRAQSIKFHWISATTNTISGTPTVTVSAMVGGLPHSAMLTFEVLSPWASIWVTTSPFAVVDGYMKEGGDPYLALGKKYRAGCQREAAVAIPSWSGEAKLGAGAIGFLQLVRFFGAVENEAGAAYDVQTSFVKVNPFVLDIGDKPSSVLIGTGHETTVTPGQTVNLGTARGNSDSPAQNLAGSRSGVMWNHFKLYLVYRSAIAGSIWITLEKLEWGCTARVKKNAQGVWDAPYDIKLSPPAGEDKKGATSDELPTWDSKSNGDVYEADKAEFDDAWSKIPTDEFPP